MSAETSLIIRAMIVQLFIYAMQTINACNAVMERAATCR